MKNTPKINLSIFLVLLTFSFILQCNAHAYNSLASVESTPFDSKLKSVGIFALNKSPNLQSSGDSVENLFQIARSFRYQKDIRDQWQTAEETELKRSGDCEDMAVWLYTKLVENGQTGARLVVGKANGITRGLHVWVTMTRPNGEELILDPASQRRIWTQSNFRPHDYQALYAFDAKGSYRYIRPSHIQT